jgi:exonuclease VII small subunit
MWRKQGGAEALEATVAQSLRSAISKPSLAQPTNGNHASSASESKGKRMNPIKRKQMEERVQDLETEIAELEASIAACETSLLTFVSAEETERLSRELKDYRADHQKRFTEWEALSQALES